MLQMKREGSSVRARLLMQRRNQHGSIGIFQKGGLVAFRSAKVEPFHLQRNPRVIETLR
jgi:hypothetical protein